jgi:hypothetical protein
MTAMFATTFDCVMLLHKGYATRWRVGTANHTAWLREHKIQLCYCHAVSVMLLGAPQDGG